MSQAMPKPEGQPVPGREDLRFRIEDRIRKLERASGNGLWSMVFFLMTSFAAFDSFSFLPGISAEMRRLLGTPPPAAMISLALVVYAFSGIVRTLARMSRNIKAFFTAFYIFYHLSGALQDNFWAVFFAGISVMGLENYYLWTHSNAALHKERALLKSMQEKGSEQ
jgi:hypothetical protein